MSEDAVERLEGTCEICGGQLPDNAFGWQTIHDSPEDCVWALQRSLEASQQEVERLRELIQAVRNSGYDENDPRIDYVTVQIDRDTWAALEEQEAQDEQ